MIPASSSKRPLDPIDRISEIWFGLVMVLTFTCSLSVKSAGREEVRTTLVDALGCNLAWGILDAFMYLLSIFVERGRSVSTLRVVRAASDPEIAHQIIAEAMPPLVAAALSSSDFERIRQSLKHSPEPPARAWLTKRDWLGAAGVFLLVFLSTFPVAVPFIFVGDPRLAFRISNGIALVMLFATGYAFGRYADYRPWKMGLWMVLVGSVLVAVTIALGG